MIYRFATFVFAALLILTSMAGSLCAQGRGRGNHPGTNVRTPPGPATAPRPAFTGRTPAPVFAPRIIGGARFNVVRPQPRVVVSQPFVGFYSPYVWSSSVYTPSYTPSPYVAPTYIAPSISQNEVELSYQVQRLSQEIEQLRQEQAAAAFRQLPPTPLPAAPDRPATPTVLIFRDGHRIVIQNYAIVGQTLWILDEKTSTKILLSELDLDATQKENRGQGVRFPLPER